jgi:3-deoxy-D-manno-octulosonic-acid transferase
MSYLLYSLLLAIALLITSPWWLWRMLVSGRYVDGLGERFGGVPERIRLATKPGQPVIWVHAVSVGEVLATTELVRRLQNKFRDWRIVVSTTTETGQKLARERFGEKNVFYLPTDFKFAIQPYLDLLKPRMLMLAETEFWPNLLRLSKQSGAKIAVVNARISDRSYPRYRAFSGLMRPALEHVDAFLAQSPLDRERLIAIGANAARVQFTGNLKFGVIARKDVPLVARLRDAMAKQQSAQKTSLDAKKPSPVIVCGSTVEGEEPMLLDAFRQLLADFPQATMILAPRHPERNDDVAAEITRRRLWCIRRSQWKDEELAGHVFLLDTIGELAAVYELATIAFVGGSLVPRGGHNILEPAQFGKPILVGPSMSNFRDIFGIFKAADAVKTVTPVNLYYEMQLLLASPEKCWEIGKRAFETFSAQVGSTERTLDALEVLLWVPSTLTTQQRDAEKAADANAGSTRA